MEIIAAKIPEKCTLIQFGDLHIGPLVCFTRGIYKLIRRLMEPNVYGINIGDNNDAITSEDSRFVIDQMMVSVNTPSKQNKWLIKNFKEPAEAGKILAWGTGNHELKLNKVLDGDEVADALGVPYGAYRYILKCLDKNGKPMFKLFFTHGTGIAQSQAKDDIQAAANYQSAVKKKLGNTGHADCIYMGMGHTHRPTVVEPTANKNVIILERGGELVQEYKHRVNQNAKHISKDERWYGVSGSFLRSLSKPGSKTTPYSEMRLYSPVELGWLEIDVEDRQVVNVRKVVV